MNRTKFFIKKWKIKIERYEADLINEIKNKNNSTRNIKYNSNQRYNSDNTNLSILLYVNYN